MDSSSSLPFELLDLAPEPDLRPLYPTAGHINSLLSSHSGLTPSQKADLVSHSLTRACVFGDLSVISYLLSDYQAQTFVDLSVRDDDGFGLVTLAIHGFGAESDRDIEREECVRLLISQGADLGGDKAGWTPLHYAVLLSPPTLVSYLMTHGCSPLALTNRNLTPLDIVSAHSILPGREDVALLLEEAMRSEGWASGRMEAKRRSLDDRTKRKGRRKNVRDDVAKALGVNPRWWGDEDSDSMSENDDDDDDDDDLLFTPPVDYSSMLVFAPPLLPCIIRSLITNFPPSLRDSSPANSLYLLARFAALTCDETWLEDLIIAATDAIEETFFNRAEDITCLAFWLYNATLLLHFLRCDGSINEACENLGLFEIIEEVINSIFVFIIRLAERKIDQFLDATILDYASPSSEFDEVLFESDWFWKRQFGSMRKMNNVNTPNSSPVRNGKAGPPKPSPRSPSPVTESSISTSASMSFSSLRETFSRARAGSTTPLQSMFAETTPPSPDDLTSFLTALHTFLTLSEINPALIVQLWSQVLYWTSCEMFNRVITRKKYLCRSRAVQIAMNVGALEEWVGQMGLPKGVQSHFAPVRDLLHWLQCLSSIQEFPDLVATIQGLKSINPLQMRRAVHDYRYEVNESKMTDECIQYLSQLQKDWERLRVKLGVEAIRKEIVSGNEGSVSSLNGGPSTRGETPSIHTVSSSDTPLNNIDILFEKGQAKSAWEPPKPPIALGELLDSRFMIPLYLPSDPRLLSALPGKMSLPGDVRAKRNSDKSSNGRTSSRERQEVLVWRSQNQRVREVDVDLLQWVDGVSSAARWARPPAFDNDDGDDENSGYPVSGGDYTHSSEGGLGVETNAPHAIPLTRKFSSRKRSSHGGGESILIEEL